MRTSMIIYGGLLAAALLAMATTANAQTAEQKAAPAKLTFPEDVTALAEPIVARVTQTTLVTIKNNDGIFVYSVSSEARPFNSTCAMAKHGMAIAIGERRRDDRYYVLYKPWSVGAMSEGECGSGALTYLDKGAFHQFSHAPPTRGNIRQ